MCKKLIQTAVLFLSGHLYAQDGLIDGTFNSMGPNPTGNFSVLSGGLMGAENVPTGGYMFYGSLTNYNGAAAHLVVKTDSLFIPDTTFLDATVFPDGGLIYGIHFQPDGKYIFYGSFNYFDTTLTYDTMDRRGIVRVLPNGNLDTTFKATGLQINHTVYASALQPDGKIIIAGNFGSFNDTATYSNIMRILPNGYIDYTFNAGTGGNNTIRSIKLQPDGKIIVGGQFTSFNGATHNRIVRLLSNGSIDPSFVAGTGASGTIYAVEIDNGGNIYAGGTFTSFNGVPKNKLVKLKPNGTISSNFSMIINLSTSEVKNIKNYNNKIFVCGNIYQVNGVNTYGVSQIDTSGVSVPGFQTHNLGMSASTTIEDVLKTPNGRWIISGIIIGAEFGSEGLQLYNSIANLKFLRLLPDGSFDFSFFEKHGPSAYVFTLHELNNGQILLGGSFYSYNGQQKLGLNKIHANGLTDATFNCPLDGYFYAFAEQPDGKILVGGTFYYFINGQYIRGIARLNPNGSIDSTFVVPGNGADPIYNILLEPNGQILVAGDFNNGFGTTTHCIAKLNSNGSIDNAFLVAMGTGPGGTGQHRIRKLIKATSGNYYIVGEFHSFDGQNRYNIAELLPSGALSPTTFDCISSNIIHTAILQSDGKLLVCGQFPPNNMYRFNTNGTIDPTFTGSTVSCWDTYFLQQPDGKLLLTFSWNVPDYKGSLVKGLIRVNLDGTIDPTFDVSAPEVVGAGNTIFLTNGMLMSSVSIKKNPGQQWIRLHRFYNGPVSTHDNGPEIPELVLFPNPVTSDLTISVPLKYEPVKYNVYNTFGQCISAGNFETQKTTLKCDLLARGTYFLEVWFTNGSRSNNIFIKN